MWFVNLNISIQSRKSENVLIYSAQNIFTIISNANVYSISSLNSLFFLQRILFINIGTPIRLFFIII